MNIRERFWGAVAGAIGLTDKKKEAVFERPQLTSSDFREERVESESGKNNEQQPFVNDQP